MKGSGLASQFSSNTDLWETPHWLFDELNEEFGFDLDVCALPENAKCPRFFTPDDDGLAQEWTGRCWMNPPYGQEIGHWLKKALESSASGAVVVCLLPARTDTRWWHSYVTRAKEIRFLKGRLSFHGTGNKAPFASAVVIFQAVLELEAE